MNSNLKSFTKHTLALTAIAASLALAACGGGGGGSSSPAAPASGASTPVTPPPDQPASGGNVVTNPTGGQTGGSSSSTASVLAAPGAATVAGFTASGTGADTGTAVETDSLTYINNVRAQVGLPALVDVAAVDVPAHNHSLYQQLNNSVGHYEVAGSPGYTGVSPMDRVTAVYPTQSVGEIAAGTSASNLSTFATSTQPIDLLFDAPFHRGIILFDTTGVGIGHVDAGTLGGLNTYTADFVDYKAFVPDNEFVAWPYNGQTNVKPAWKADESPNPLQAAYPQLVGSVVGYPITLSAAGNGAYSNVAFSIKDAAGNPVTCAEVDSSNNAEATRLAACVPIAPLAVNTTYTVTVTGDLTNTTITTPLAFNVSWSFTTAASLSGGTNTTGPAVTYLPSPAVTAVTPNLAPAGSAATIKAQTKSSVILR